MLFHKWAANELGGKRVFVILGGKRVGRQKSWAANELGGKLAGRQKSVCYTGHTGWQKSWTARVFAVGGKRVFCSGRQKSVCHFGWQKSLFHSGRQRSFCNRRKRSFRHMRQKFGREKLGSQWSCSH